MPFVGSIEPLAALERGAHGHGSGNLLLGEVSNAQLLNLSLLAEYEAGSTIFRQKIKSLEAMYKAMRRTRGDGNWCASLASQRRSEICMHASEQSVPLRAS